jgi:hypothetical protein
MKRVHYNRKRGEVFVARSTIAEHLGFSSRGHRLKEAKDAYVQFGFLVVMPRALGLPVDAPTPGRTAQLFEIGTDADSRVITRRTPQP